MVFFVLDSFIAQYVAQCPYNVRSIRVSAIGEDITINKININKSKCSTYIIK